MSTKKKTVVLKALPGFQPGHARYGGRTKRTAAQARALADELGVDPFAYLLNLLAVDATDEVEFTAEGDERRVKVPVSRDLKIDICKSLAGFFYPKLNSTAVSNDGAPMAVVEFDMSKLMADPDAVEAAQKLALLIAESDQTPAPDRRYIPGDVYQRGEGQ
jgi:hypothetical protein